jgi:hypothetical protein
VDLNTERGLSVTRITFRMRGHFVPHKFGDNTAEIEKYTRCNRPFSNEVCMGRTLRRDMSNKI